MKTLGDLGCGCNPRHFFDAISLHHYTVPGDWPPRMSATDFDTDAYYLTMRAAGRIDELLTRHGTIMDAYDPTKRIGLVLDEWGTWFHVEEGTNPGFLYQQNTLRDALVASLHFDSFHRHADRLVMANIAQVVNVLQAMLLTDGDTLVRTPTYHVFEMNKGHHDADSLALAWIGDPLPTPRRGRLEHHARLRVGQHEGRSGARVAEQPRPRPHALPPPGSARGDVHGRVGTHPHGSADSGSQHPGVARHCQTPAVRRGPADRPGPDRRPPTAQLRDGQPRVELSRTINSGPSVSRGRLAVHGPEQHLQRQRAQRLEGWRTVVSGGRK